MQSCIQEKEVIFSSVYSHILRVFHYSIHSKTIYQIQILENIIF